MRQKMGRKKIQQQQQTVKLFLYLDLAVSRQTSNVFQLKTVQNLEVLEYKCAVAPWGKGLKVQQSPNQRLHRAQSKRAAELALKMVKVAIFCVK